MSQRVVFRPADRAPTLSIDELGHAATGAWGVIDDQRWMAARDGAALQLLYLSLGEYQHAMRRLPEEAVARAVDLRRSTFSTGVAGRALGEIERAVFACIGSTVVDDTEGAALRADLLTALASFTGVPRYGASAPSELFDYLREGDSEIIAELSSPSLRAAEDLDPDGSERAVRRRWAVALGALGPGRDVPGNPEAMPYFDVERAWLVAPATPELESRAHVFHDPTLAFGGGLIMPVAERHLPELEALGHRLTVVFPARGPFVWALSDLTGEQLEVEIADRLASPGFARYLALLRLQEAILRVATRLIAGTDAGIERALAVQTTAEAARLGTWLAIGGGANSAIAGEGATATELLARAIDDATFLAALCRRDQRDRIAARLDPLARALGQVAASRGS